VRRGLRRGRWMQVSLVAVIFLSRLSVASWTAHILTSRTTYTWVMARSVLRCSRADWLDARDAGRLAISPKIWSRQVVRVSLVGTVLAGPLVGLSTSLATFFTAFLLWGIFQGSLDVSMNAQAIAVEGRLGRRLMPGFHGSWSMGSLAGAGVGVLGVGLGWSLSGQLLIFAVPFVVVVGGCRRRWSPTIPFESSVP